MEMVEIDLDKLNELKRKAGAYDNARDNKRDAQAELSAAQEKIADLEATESELREQISGLTADRDAWKISAEQWYDWVRHELPQWFDRRGKLLDKPRKMKSQPKSIMTQDDDITSEPTSTQTLPAVKRPSRVRNATTTVKDKAKKIKLPNLNG